MPTSRHGFSLSSIVATCSRISRRKEILASEQPFPCVTSRKQADSSLEVSASILELKLLPESV